MRSLSFLSSALFVSSTLAIGQKPTVNFDGNGLELVSGGSAVQIMCDAADYPGVLRVCDDLALDFGKVTGTNGSVTLMGDGPAMNASMIFNITGRTSFEMESGGASGGVIIAGTIGNSSMIDRLVSEGKIDVIEIEGEWEAYVSALVDSPMDGVDKAMVIAGEYSRMPLLKHKKLTVDQAPTAEAQSTASTPSRNKSASPPGTGSPTPHLTSTPPSTPPPPQSSKALLQSNTAASSSTTKPQL